MTIFNIGERAKTNGMIFVQSILVTYYGLNLELGGKFSPKAHCEGKGEALSVS